MGHIFFKESTISKAHHYGSPFLSFQGCFSWGLSSVISVTLTDPYFFCWLQYLAFFFFVPRDSEKKSNNKKSQVVLLGDFLFGLGFLSDFITIFSPAFWENIFPNFLKASWKESRVASHPSCFCIYLRIYTKLFMANQPAHLPTPKKRYPRKYVPGNPSDQGGTP